MLLAPWPVVRPCSVLRIVLAAAQRRLRRLCIRLKKFGVVIDWRCQLSVAVIKLRGCVPSRIEIDAASDVLRLYPGDMQRRVVAIEQQDFVTGGVRGWNINGQIFRFDLLSVARHPDAADLPAGEITVLFVGNLDAAAKIYVGGRNYDAL